jgi:hypothetical protein
MAHQMSICLRHGLMCVLEELPIPWESGSILLARPVILGYFLDEYCACGFEILMYGSSRCKLLKKLSFGSRRISMSGWHLVKHKGIC